MSASNNHLLWSSLATKGVHGLLQANGASAHARLATVRQFCCVINSSASACPYAPDLSRCCCC
ncbi:hypothetical protein T440DRAFT_285283 [Plenodomus tracheiphilus IPT5]|uniref:Uncharacterized protein n=1 Tax=Plenodomus tracheiphilus IPT5 TaxID=1408161 RepID=A0A6A7BEA7_9PLEO|nr:hypothetical protein T440DRAFT_285283 [Plenodomus tracheiphilus IPT5]